MEFPFGVHGALEDQALKGRNWRGRTADWFRTEWGVSRFGSCFASSTSDATGTIQVRAEGDYWVLAFALPFADWRRNQRTWRVVRLGRGQLWDWVLSVVDRIRGLAVSDLLELEALNVQRDEARERRMRRGLLPLLRRLDVLGDDLPGSEERKVVFADCSFEELLVLASFYAELLHPRAAEPGSGPSFVVLSQPLTSRGNRTLLEAGWGAMFSPPPAEENPTGRGGATRRETEPYPLVPSEDQVRGVGLAELQALPDEEFDALFEGFRAGAQGDLRWNIERARFHPTVWTSAEWDAEFERLLELGDRDAVLALSAKIADSELEERRMELAGLEFEQFDSKELTPGFLRDLEETG